MEAGSQMQRFLKHKLFSWRLSLAWILMYCFFIQDATAHSDIHLRGEIGGNLTFRCPVNNLKSIQFFYFQRNGTFINGFHTSRKITTQTWSNTKMDDKDRTTVHMFNLNASHAGDYECHIKYSKSLNKTVINVSMKANYSKPQPTKECIDGLNCVVHCASHGGYPSVNITWDVPEGHVGKFENHPDVTDPETMTVNSSSSASFNCSSGELSSIRCRVGDIASDNITVCKPGDPLEGTLHVMRMMIIIIIPVCIVVISLAVLMATICCCKPQKRKRGPAEETKVELAGYNPIIPLPMESVCLRDKQEETPEHQDEIRTHT